MKDKIDQLGDILIKTFHIVGLFVVGVTIVWSATHEYFKTHKIPVIFLIFITITVITRFLVIDMKSLMAGDKFNLLVMVVSILILFVTAGVLRFTEKNIKLRTSTRQQ